MKIITAIIILLIFLLLINIIFIISSIIVNCKNWKYYKKGYKSLNRLSFYKYGNIIYSYKHDDFIGNHDGIIFFEDGSIKVNHLVYLHNSNVTLLDPYSLYWYIKYRKWFKKNININALPDW